MNEVAKKAPSSPTDHMRLPEYLSAKIFESGFSNKQIAEAIGYPNGNVVSMMKTGNMKLPLNRIAQMARKINVDPKYLMAKVMTESQPEVWGAICEVFDLSSSITENELDTVQWFRRLLNGADAALMEDAEFTRTVEPILDRIGKRDRALINATNVLAKRA